MKKVLFCVFVMSACMSLFAQKQPVVAVAPFDAISGVSATDTNMITRVFNIRLGNTKTVTLVDRNIIDRVLQEHKFQLGDWSNNQKTAELGRALNADWIVRGELEKFGSNILVTVQFYDIRTFAFKGGSDLRLANVDEAYDKMDPLVNKLVETIKNSSITTTYKIGDFGPAGGIVFYDKGNFANGWRYMEVAPVETEYLAQFGNAFPTDDWLTNEEAFDFFYKTGEYADTFNIGYGKSNTENLIRQLSGSTNSRTAARLCDSLSYNGYSDWFLPSVEELAVIDISIKQKGLGGFTNTYYWSSSFHPGGWPMLYWFFYNEVGREIYLGVLDPGDDDRSSLHYVRAVRRF